MKEFYEYQPSRYDLTRGDVTPVTVMFEMCDIMDYMMSFNEVLDDIQNLSNQANQLKPQLWALSNNPANKQTDADKENNKAQANELMAKITSINQKISDMLMNHSSYMEQAIVNGIAHAYKPYLAPTPNGLIQNSLHQIKGVISYLIDRYTSRGVMLPTMNLNYFYIMTLVNDMAENISIANGYRCRSFMVDNTYVESEKGANIDIYGTTVNIKFNETTGYEVTLNGEKTDVLVMEHEPSWKSIHVKDYITFKMPYNDTIFDIYVFIMNTDNINTDEE